MDKIALAKNVNFIEGETDNLGTIVIEPLYPGYGMTLGNSIRRVLLSSLPGHAVVGVKIQGANHEFTTIEGIKEDVLEILLNIKQLRFRAKTEEEQVLILKAKGKKLVKAKDIEKNTLIEVVNQDLVIANLNDEKSSLDLEIFVQAGRGYHLNEVKKKGSKDLGFIEIDSIFSPVLAVSLDVKNTRVGKMTNWDKLLINLETDGTISPMEAYLEANQILIDQFTALDPKNHPAKEEEEEEKEGEEKEEEESSLEQEIDIEDEKQNLEDKAPKAKSKKKE